MKNIHSLYLLLASTLFLACQSKIKENNASTADSVQNTDVLVLSKTQLQNTNIRIGKLEKSNISGQLALNGSIEVPPQNLVSVSFPLGGYLKNTHLLPGTHVRKGEVIALIEDQQFIELQKNYLIAKSQVEYLKKEAERQQKLSTDQSASQKDAQLAALNLQTETVNLNALKEKLQLIGVNPQHISSTNISKTVALRSPIDGFVTKVNALIGKYFNPSEELFQLVNPVDIHLNLKVFQQDLDKVKIGQEVICYLPSEPNRTFKAEIILISRNVNENQTVDVHCHFHDYDKKLVPGMFMNAVVEISSEKNYTVPEDAVVQFENKNYLFLANNEHTFQMVPVQIGATENHQTVIFNADTASKYVLNDAYTLLLELKKSDEE